MRGSSAVWIAVACAWKDKTLDYEIETRETQEKWERHHRPWKDKTLDYEIETDPDNLIGEAYHNTLEKIRLSITRLKLQYLCIRPNRCLSWKDKTLDYEIETWECIHYRYQRIRLKR